MQYTSREVYEYISKHTNDPIIEWKTCAVSGVEFPITQSDLDFYDKVSPTLAGRKFQIPTPTLCPEERQRRRLSFRNERKLYKRTCDATGKNIISIYNPDKPYTVYDQSYRWSDKRDPMGYGFEFDFSKTFTENFSELMLVIPTMNLFVTPDATENNCIYVNSAWFNKNSYYIFDSDQNEDCMFSNILKNSKNSMECTATVASEHCYELLYSSGCYECKYCKFCSDCSNCINCTSCMSCSNCINCQWLVNKSYCINNIEYSVEEYHNNIKQFEICQYTDQPIVCNVHNVTKSCENIAGSSLISCRDVILCFDCTNLQNAKYCEWVMNGTADLYDHSSFGEESTRTLECEWTGRRVSDVLFWWNIFLDSRNILYSRTCCQWSHDLFGCIWLRNKQYCIFNRQYTKEEYEIQVAKIITHMQSTWEWWEFFHPSLSPFGYNETVAQEYYPIEVKGDRLYVKGDEGIELWTHGYKPSNYSSDPKIPDTAQVIRPTEISDEDRARLADTDDILRQAILCEISNRPYMIQKAELEFYRKHKLLIPRKHPDIRHEERMKLRPGRTLYLRTCDCCGEEMLSVYSQDHEWKVYCESCYQQQVFS